VSGFFPARQEKRWEDPVGGGGGGSSSAHANGVWVHAGRFEMGF
jgi:hypothetical protein